MTNSVIKGLVNITRNTSGYDLVPLIDYHALNVEIDNFKGSRPAFFVMLPTREDTRLGNYSEEYSVRIEIVGVQETKFSGSDRIDFNAVDTVAESLKADILKIIRGIVSSGEYDNVSRIIWATVPYRFDSLRTAVTAQSDLVKSLSPC